jgi:hypothetical protein
MLDGSGETVRHYTGLPCVFNPGGIPNRGPLFKDLADQGAPGEGVAVFTWDGAPDAKFWTIETINHYLLWRHNTAQVWIKNLLPTFSCDLSPIVLAAEGMNLLQALAAASELVHADVAECYAESKSLAEPPPSCLQVVPAGQGTVRVIQRQPLNADRTHPPLDLAATNLFTASIAEATTGCVTRPIVAGGQELVQITIPLYRAWDTSRMVLADGDVPDDPDLESQYAKRYTTTGQDFYLYTNVGRLWDANTDGRYVKAPYLAPVPDMAVLADEASWSWPRMPYIPHPMLVSQAVQVEEPSGAPKWYAPTQEAVVEVCYDGGTTWWLLAGFKPLPDRLGIFIDAPNLGDLSIPGTEEGDAVRNLFEALLADKTNSTSLVKLRLTCTVEAPRRRIEQPAWRDSAGTGFATAEWFDRGAVGQKRRIASSCTIQGTVLWADLSNDALTTLEDLATAVQDASEDRTIEANLPMEWLEEPVGLTDVIKEIGGIRYDLRVKVGGVPRSPWIVGRTIHFQNWSQTLLLGSDRKAGTVWRPATKTWLPGGIAGWEVPNA